MKRLYHTSGAAETQALAQMLAGLAPPHPLFALRGGLGAGKTCFVQGLCTGLGIQAFVTSPTFAVANEYRYQGRRLIHLDLYRLSGPDELDSIGWDEYVDSGDPMAVEWPERAGDLLPPGRVVIIDIATGPGENDRTFTVQFPDSAP